MFHYRHNRNLIMHFDFFRNRKLIKLYVSMALTTLYISLIGLFVPLYLLEEIGLSFNAVMYYLCIVSISVMLSFIFLIKATSKIGLNKIAMLSVPIQIIYLLMLNGLKSYPIPLAAVAIMSGLGGTMFWLPYHKRFAESSDQAKMGTELGVRYALSGLFVILGPILGGFIATYMGFSSLYIIGGIILAISIVPLFLIEEEYFDKELKIVKLFKGRTFKEFLGYFGEGLRFGAETLWPILIFLIIGSYLSLGEIFSGVSLLNVVFQLFIGYISDFINKDNLLRIGTAVDAVTMVARVFLYSVYSIFAITAISGFSVSAWYVVYSSKYYEKMRKTDGVSQILFREIGLGVGRIAVYILAIIIGLKWSIASSALFMFLLWLF